jgi:hypothetical protein
MLLFGMSGRDALRHVQGQRVLALTNPEFASFLATLRGPAGLRQVLS